MVSHRRFPHAPRTGLAGRITLLYAAASAAVTLVAAPVLADPAPPVAVTTDGSSSDGGTDGAAAAVDLLLAEAERAVEAYNATAERVADRQAEADLRAERVAQAQQAVNERRSALGSAAAAHYRAGGISPSLALWLSTDPEGYLARAATWDRISDRQSWELRDLLATQRTLEQRRQEAEDALAKLTAEQRQLARDKQAAQRRLADARQHLELLRAEEREDRQQERLAALAATPDPGSRAPDSVPASGRAAAAVSAALSAIGLPYGWGQAGPSAFDCSGLMQWAWARAGIALPRTSQGQAAAGRPVPLDQAQPGDIVVYRADASHVGMYVGGDRIVHAPHPGASVRYDAVGIMPVASVVRP